TFRLSIGRPACRSRTRDSADCRRETAACGAALSTETTFKRKEASMLRFAMSAAALAIMTMAAGAQNSSGNGQGTSPRSQNSRAGIPGMPGNKNGPAATGAGQTTGSAGGQGQNSNTRQQDPAKIPGMLGGKSGPAAKPPSTSK